MYERLHFRSLHYSVHGEDEVHKSIGQLLGVLLSNIGKEVLGREGLRLRLRLGGGGMFCWAWWAWLRVEGRVGGRGRL